jgi:hypothetical protein
MQTFISQSQALSQSSQETINITRSLTRFKAMYITFLGHKATELRQEFLGNCNDFYSPICNTIEEAECAELVHLNGRLHYYVDTGLAQHGHVIDANYFLPKRYFARGYGSTNELWYQIQLGSKLYPEYMVKSNAEAWYHLSKTLEIKSDAYYNHEFVIGQCLEKVEGASFSGINTKMGDLLTIRLWNQAPNAADRPNKLFVFMVGDAILNISDTGCQFFY